MEDDQLAVLTLRAAVRNVVDYSQAKLEDPGWWRYHLLMLRGLLQEDHIAISKENLHYHESYFGNSGLSEDSYSQVQQKAATAFSNYVELLRPWDKNDIHQNGDEKLRDAWFEAFNVDPNDPDWEKKHNEQIEIDSAMLAEAAKNSPESQQEIVLRRIAEREHRLANQRKLRRIVSRHFNS